MNVIENRTNLLTFRPKKVKIKLRKCIGGVAVSVKLTPQHVEAIEKALNHKGKTEAVIRQDNGEVTVLMVEKKKIS